VCLRSRNIQESLVPTTPYCKGSWFLPFNQGWNDGAGNPPNLDGLKTDYLWKRILTRDGLTDILENYAQVVETKDEKTGNKKAVQIWPRFHQLDVVRRLLADAQANGGEPLPDPALGR
jgi:type I restriction enzyme, R subunit